MHPCEKDNHYIGGLCNCKAKRLIEFVKFAENLNVITVEVDGVETEALYPAKAVSDYKAKALEVLKEVGE